MLKHTFVGPLLEIESNSVSNFLHKVLLIAEHLGALNVSKDGQKNGLTNGNHIRKHFAPAVLLSSQKVSVFVAVHHLWVG